MEYLLQEGSFSLFPANWQDTSMTVLRDNDSGLSIIVSRGTIPTGSDFEKEFHRQWDVLSTQMSDINQSEFQRIFVGSDRKTRAVEVETSFTGKGQPARQKQFAVQVPDTAVIMIFTLSALRAFDDKDQARWEGIKQSLKLHE